MHTSESLRDKLHVIERRGVCERLCIFKETAQAAIGDEPGLARGLPFQPTPEQETGELPSSRDVEKQMLDG